MMKWGAEIVSDIPVSGAEDVASGMSLPEDNGPLTKAMADAFVEVEKWNLLVRKCVIKLDGPVVTITTYPQNPEGRIDECVYDPHGNPIIGHVEGQKCYECGVVYFERHPYNGCPLAVVEEVMTK